MKRIVKSKGFWLVLILLLGIAAAVALLRPKPLAQIITLSNGDEYEYEGVTYGTNLVPPSLLCRVVDRLPAGLTNLASKIFGKRIIWSRFLPPDRPAVSVWFKLTKTNGPVLPGGVTALVTRLADENGYERDLPGFFGPDRNISVFEARYGWNRSDLVNVPKRSPVLNVVYLLPNGTNTQKIALRNPLYRKYPQWVPKDTLPATRNFGDLQVQVGKLEFQPKSSSVPLATPKGPFYVQTSVFWNPAPEWVFVRAGLDDATGNHIAGIEPGPFNFSPDNKRLRFPGFWPGENAWRLSLVFERSSDFPPESIITFTNVPIPPIGATNFVPIINSLGDIKVRISSFYRDRNSQVPGTQNYFPYIGIDLPEHPAEWQAEIIDVQTPFGKPDLRSALDEDPDGTRHLGYIPTNAATVNVTVAVQKPLKLEFYIKPPTP